MGAGPSCLPWGTSSHLGRGWEGARVCQGDEKLGVRDPVCSLLQRRLPGVGWDGMGCLSCSIPFPAGSSQAQLREDRAGQIHPWRKAGGGERPQPRQALCSAPSNGTRPPLSGSCIPRAQHPKCRRGAGLARCSWLPGLRSVPLARWHSPWSRRASRISPPCWVWRRQRNAIALVTCRSPLSPMSLSGHTGGDRSIPSCAMWCRGHLAAPSPSDEYLGCSCRSFLTGAVGKVGSGGEEGNHD